MISLPQAIARVCVFGRNAPLPAGFSESEWQDVEAVAVLINALLGQPGPGQVVEMLRAELGPQGPAKPVPLHSTGVPMNAEDWTEQDWLDLHQATKEAVRHISKRHRPGATLEERGAPTASPLAVIADLIEAQTLWMEAKRLYELCEEMPSGYSPATRQRRLKEYREAVEHLYALHGVGKALVGKTSEPAMAPNLKNADGRRVFTSRVYALDALTAVLCAKFGPDFTVTTK